MDDIKGQAQQFTVEVEKDETSLKVPKKSNLKDNENLSSGELLFTVEDTPPWYLCIFLAFQHYLTFLGSVISLPFLLAPALCLNIHDPARVYLTSTMLFIFGFVTLLQTIVGIRLPIVQGGSFAYLVPAFVILNLPEWRCPTINETMVITSDTNITHDDIWMSRIRELQGDVALASIFQIFIGISGLSGFILKWITPLVITPTITLIGLSLFRQSTKLAGKNWPVSLGSIVLMILFSQYLRDTKIPLPMYTRRKGFKTLKYPIFGLLPVLLSTAIMWGLCAILTSCNVFGTNDPARTDMGGTILSSSPWIRVSYPLQWGLPTASIAGVVGMMSAVIASVVESIGDYYACARLSGAPPPPVSAINRGIAVEGFGGVLAGLWGVGVGATSFSQNIGAISITKVGSRRVIQYAAFIMILFGTFTKFGAAFAIIPEPIIGGIYCVMFGIITGVGISSAQFVDLNSPRNLFILGFSIFFGLAFPTWISNHNPIINTGTTALDQALTVLLSTNMLVGGILGFVLDNTIPGTDEERGLTKWNRLKLNRENNDTDTTYRIPFNFREIQKFFTNHCAPRTVRNQQQ